MARVVVRNLEEAVKQQLKARAASRDHSMEEEIRQILRRAGSTSAPHAPPAARKGFGAELKERLGNSPLSTDEWQEFDADIEVMRRNDRQWDVDLGS